MPLQQTDKFRFSYRRSLWHSDLILRFWRILWKAIKAVWYFVGNFIKKLFCIFNILSFGWETLKTPLHLYEMCRKCWRTTLEKGGNELRFPTTQHSHSSVQSQFTVPALLLLLTPAILPHSSTTSTLTMPAVTGSLAFSTPKRALKSLHLNRCRAEGWLSNLPHMENKWTTRYLVHQETKADETLKKLLDFRIFLKQFH